MNGSFVGMWDQVKRSVEEEGVGGVRAVLGFVMGGPCCVTFSKMNRVNWGRGCAYRDAEGEPVDGVYGDQARQGGRSGPCFSMKLLGADLATFDSVLVGRAGRPFLKSSRCTAR